MLENIKVYNISYGVTIPIKNIKIMTLVNSVILKSKYAKLDFRTLFFWKIISISVILIKPIFLFNKDCFY